MKTTHDGMTADDAVTASPAEATADTRIWQAEKIRAGLRDADAGRFASGDEVRAVIQQFIPNG